ILAPQLLHGDLGYGSDQAVSDEAREQFTVLCIAYHNLAVEHEHLKNLEAAACAYAEGYRWAARFLGPSHQLRGILRDSAEAVKAKLPATSGALRRANQLLTEGWPQPSDSRQRASEGSSANGQHDRSQQLDNLLTPRHAGAEGSPSMASLAEGGPSKYTNEGNSEEYSVHFSDQGGSLSEQASRTSGP
ncbi:unnamed protein product, partial [Polarella glacialis]